MTRPFSSISRYRRLPVAATVGPDGRVLASKALRLLPVIEGRFWHTVQEGDRLDHLAYKYYEQPRDWWRILDANPSFLSPDALLGTGHLTTIHVPVAWVGALPPWSDLLRDLRRTVGIETARLGSPDQLHPTIEILTGPLLFDIPTALTAALDASARAQVLDAALAAALAAEGVEFSDRIRITRVDAATWRLDDRQDHRVYTVRHFPADPILTVHESAVRFDWLLVTTFDGLLRSTADVIAATEARGFAPGQAAEVGRIGKPIVIPPRRA